MRTGKLTERKVRCRSKRGYLNDGGGLYLRVAPGGSKQWVFRFAADGRLREMGLGAIETLTLAEAREKARECRKLRLDGIDPIEQRRAGKAARYTTTVRTMTFKKCAEAYLAAHWEAWSPSTQQLWSRTLATYAYPVLGDVAVAAISLDLILQVIEPIWKTKTQTADRTRNRIEAVLDWAAVLKYRQGDNPARWRGHLDQLLPARSKIQKVEHYAAMPFSEVGAFIAELRDLDGTAARALEFTILTAVRSNEAHGARWSEINFAERVWTIPAERMTKTDQEHRVPLTERVLEILKEQQQGQQGDFVFSSGPRRAIDRHGMWQLLKRTMGRKEFTVHGFRSTFRDWAAETTNFPREVCEMALAHTVSNEVEAAYRRGDLFAKRRQLMEAWGRYCAQPAKAGEVVALRPAGGG
jgi:integrase